MTVLRTSEAVAEHGRGRVRHAVASGRWQRPARGVIVTHNGPLAPDETHEVRLALCPPRSALGGATALALDGLTGFESTSTYAALPEGAVKPRYPGLITHWSTLLEGVDVHPTREPRRTRTARSLVDFASWAASDRHARAAVLAAFQQRLVAERTMLEVLDRRGTVLRSGLVRESVYDAVGGVQSLPEKDFADIVSLAGLPRPTRQRAVKGREGRYFLDVDWEAYGVAVEVHGLPHHGVASWSDDLVRANEVVIGGPRLLVFTSYVIRHEPRLVLDQLVRALRSGGWTGQARPAAILSRSERWRRRTMRG
ncbi:MAG: hypothetical protein QM621_12800 [Aeromicrobium sp.]|uniref:hypothetical protein n=1 Tax=Aeromicrobium sp. TaxID=1871063 RepID=UPI0039E2F646